MESVTMIAAYIKSQLVTWAFLALALSLFVWVIRLHFDERFKNFDLTKLIEQADGSPDGEKIRVWVTYAVGTYAFLYLLVHDHATFASYAPLFIGITFTHLVANRMTVRPQLPPVTRPMEGP